WPQGVASPAAELPVCVEFVVGEDGAVHSQRLLDGVPDCVAATQPGITPFVDAALTAVAQWQFFGAGMCTWQQEEAECSDSRAEVTPLAIRLSYRFRFSAGTPGQPVAVEAL
ncbi:MAG: energy transducer TonB, partial [Stenotrophomonas koreensis]